jgi:hypothetical protein
MPSANGGGRPFALRGLPKGLRQSAREHGFRRIGAGVSLLWAAGSDVIYNLDRPHEALDLEVPASRYRPSARAMPDRLPEVEYDEHEIVRTVSTTKHYVSVKGRLWKVPKAFRGERVAIRPRSTDGRYGIFFASRQIATIDLTRSKSVSDVSEHGVSHVPGLNNKARDDICGWIKHGAHPHLRGRPANDPEPSKRDRSRLQG